MPATTGTARAKIRLSLGIALWGRLVLSICVEKGIVPDGWEVKTGSRRHFDVSVKNTLPRYTVVGIPNLLHTLGIIVKTPAENWNPPVHKARGMAKLLGTEYA